MIPFTGLQQARAGRQEAMPGEVMWPWRPFSSRFGRGGHQSGLTRSCAFCLYSQIQYLPLTHLLCDSHCTSFRPLFIPTLPVASPPKPYGRPLAVFLRRTIPGTNIICLVSVNRTREAPWFLLGGHPSISNGSEDCLILDESRLWPNFNNKHDLTLYYRGKINTVSSTQSILPSWAHSSSQLLLNVQFPSHLLHDTPLIFVVSQSQSTAGEGL